MVKKKNKKPWPTKKAMEQIYDKKLWGGGEEHYFYSGEGSHHLSLVTPYLEKVKTFLKSHETPLRVCDLGCGDFNIGKELVDFTNKYEAVDIAENLINYNKEKFDKEHLTFHCLNIAVDPLPEGDCAILRQVLQHLSNAEIIQIISKLSNFKYLIVTEHVPKGEFVPNKDIISGQGIRIKKQSGVNLLVSPFNLQVKKETILLELKPQDLKGKIVTTLYEI